MPLTSLDSLEEWIVRVAEFFGLDGMHFVYNNILGENNVGLMDDQDYLGVSIVAGPERNHAALIIRPDLPCEDAAFTVAHEMAHIVLDRAGLHWAKDLAESSMDEVNSTLKQMWSQSTYDAFESVCDRIAEIALRALESPCSQPE